MTLTIGSMFSGVGGLDMAVESVFSATTSWHCEWEDAPSKVLAKRWPGVPNFRDVTAVDWENVPPVDIITGGFPCQDVSLAGRRAGMTEGTRSNLWGAMRTAIETIQPRYVVAENVRGLLSARASSDSDMESGEGPLGDDGPPNLRAIGRVLGDLSDLGYDAQWRGLRAADVGAPHGRFRVFIFAERRDAVADPGGFGGHQAIEHHGGGTQDGDRSSVFDQPDREPVWTGPFGAEVAEGPDLATGDQRGISAPGQAESGRARPGTGRRGGTPGADAGSERRLRGPSVSGEGRNEAVRGETFNHASDSSSPRPDTDWGPYAPAVRHWEAVLRRAAPAPTELTAKGKHRLSAHLVEWMMGLPAGWVTDIDISRNEQLKALGNGVVPQQAAAALDHMLSTAT